MASETEINGQATNRVAEQLRDGRETPSSELTDKNAATRKHGPFDEKVRLCLSVPAHIVKRLEAHAKANGKKRDEFATSLLGKAMQRSFGKRDEHLRQAFSAPDEKPD